MSNTLPTMSALPDELIINIIGHVIDAEVPMDLLHFLDGGHDDHSPPLIKSTPLLSKLHETQQIHQLDWMFVNGTCRRIRQYGRAIFFEHKTLILTPKYVRSIFQANYLRLFEDVENLIFHNVQRLIVPLFDTTAPFDLGKSPGSKTFAKVKNVTFTLSRYRTARQRLDDLQRHSFASQKAFARRHYTTRFLKEMVILINGRMPEVEIELFIVHVGPVLSNYSADLLFTEWFTPTIYLYGDMMKGMVEETRLREPEEGQL